MCMHCPHRNNSYPIDPITIIYMQVEFEVITMLQVYIVTVYIHYIAANVWKKSPEKNLFLQDEGCKISPKHLQLFILLQTTTKMVAEVSYETSANTYETTRCHNPEIQITDSSGRIKSFTPIQTIRITQDVRIQSSGNEFVCNITQLITVFSVQAAPFSSSALFSSFLDRVFQ